jgi:D-alanyl-lipoteichoic acid acyltransferase DltB (MBOAT superfamily)
MDGIRMILMGYFKKLVVADRLAIFVNAAYDNQQYHNGTTLLLATVFFAFQIYADFSGYTDIAMGSAKLFGFDLTNNFRRPYLSTSIKEFWERWHITFSTWLRDYIFLPLAYSFSHGLKKQKYLFIDTDKLIYSASILITFLICGMWHGVGWTFLIWGGLFGVYLTVSNLTKSLQRDFRKRLGIHKKSKLRMGFNILLTFSLVTFTWIFFRAQNLNEAFEIIGENI